MIALPQLNFNRTPVTLIIAAVAAALEIVCTLDELAHGDDAVRRLHYYNNFFGILPSIWSGQVWRPFTTALMHGNFFHAAFNIYWMVLFGSALETRLGPYRYGGLVILLGYVSMLPQFIVSTYNANPIMIVGLSGILYGLLGILTVGRRYYTDLAAVCDLNTIRFLLFWLLLCFLLTYSRLLPVANTAHVAGLVFGLAYGLAMFDARRRLQWLSLAVVGTVLVLAVMIACPGHRGYKAIKFQQQWNRVLEDAKKGPALKEPEKK
jgi:membrane associated rhomboid family serine protease